MIRRTVFLSTLLIVTQAAAVEISKQIEKQYLSLGGNPRALKHLKCLLRHQEGRRIPIKKLDPGSGFVGRCNQYPEVSLQNFDYGVIVNYTTLSNRRQLHLIPTERNPNGKIRAYYVSHGRYGNTPRDNTTPGPGANTVLQSKYYSNVNGMNAAASGFYVTGEPYFGEWQGNDPKAPRRSMYVHGAEPNHNDNACERAIVFHGNERVVESGPGAGMHMMSSGCFMLDYDYVDSVISMLKAPNGGGGSAMLVYTNREANLPEDYYCR